MSNFYFPSSENNFVKLLILEKIKIRRRTIGHKLRGVLRSGGRRTQGGQPPPWISKIYGFKRVFRPPSGKIPEYAPDKTPSMSRDENARYELLWNIFLNKSNSLISVHFIIGSLHSLSYLIFLQQTIQLEPENCRIERRHSNNNEMHLMLLQSK